MAWLLSDGVDGGLGLADQVMCALTKTFPWGCLHPGGNWWIFRSSDPSELWKGRMRVRAQKVKNGNPHPSPSVTPSPRGRFFCANHRRLRYSVIFSVSETATDRRCLPAECSAYCKMISFSENGT